MFWGDLYFTCFDFFFLLNCNLRWRRRSLGGKLVGIVLWSGNYWCQKRRAPYMENVGFKYPWWCFVDGHELGYKVALEILF